MADEIITYPVGKLLLLITYNFYKLKACCLGVDKQ